MYLIMNRIHTPIKNDGIKVSPAARWARQCRSRIPKHLRFCFDIECDPKYQDRSVKQKTELANMLSMAKFKGAAEDRRVISEEDYNNVLDMIDSSRVILNARNVLFARSWAELNFLNDLQIMRQKALDSEDVNKLISVYKLIDSKESKLIELRQLNKRKPKVKKPEPEIYGDPLADDPD